jgi:hypothetical protein
LNDRWTIAKELPFRMKKPQENNHFPVAVCFTSAAYVTGQVTKNDAG